MQKGKASLLFENPVYVAGMASVAGKKEGEGPLGKQIDVVEADPMFGADNWKKAVSTEEMSGICLLEICWVS